MCYKQHRNRRLSICQVTNACLIVQSTHFSPYSIPPPISGNVRIIIPWLDLHYLNQLLQLSVINQCSLKAVGELTSLPAHYGLIWCLIIQITHSSDLDQRFHQSEWLVIASLLYLLLLIHLVVSFVRNIFCFNQFNCC